MKRCFYKFCELGKHTARVLLVLIGAALASCGDEVPEYPEFYAVDLGLSVDWAWCNQGAIYPEESGTLFEVSESDYSCISGTDIDPAHVGLGDGWRIPTEAEMRELVEKCKWKTDTLIDANGQPVYGMTAKGPNGNRIFFPSICIYNISSYYSDTRVTPMPYATGNLDLRLFTVKGEYQKNGYGPGHYYKKRDFSPYLEEETREAFLEAFYIRPVKNKATTDVFVPDVEVDDNNNETYKVKGVSFKMVFVEGGTFTMGCSHYMGDERPEHKVTLDGFHIGETEVTQELWRAVMGSYPSHFAGDFQRPVECVSWSGCQTFIKKLNQLTGENFRLPTEAEWEYAARGGKEGEGYEYSGSNTIKEVAWYNSISSNTTHAVKIKQPNELGIYDMSGNVREWCSDWYGSYPSFAQTNPTGPSSGSERVARGGSYDDESRFCRVAQRAYYSPDIRSTSVGFRLAR